LAHLADIVCLSFRAPFHFSELFVALATADYEMSLPGMLGTRRPGTAIVPSGTNVTVTSLHVCAYRLPELCSPGRQKAYMNPRISGQCRRKNRLYV